MIALFDRLLVWFKQKSSLSKRPDIPLHPQAQQQVEDRNDGEPDPSVESPGASAGEFDEAWYLATNADVKQAGADPWSHYLAHGEAEGRDPNAAFSTLFYRSMHLSEDPSSSPLQHYKEIGRERGLATRPATSIFDAEWYCDKYKDVRTSGFDPLKHFLTSGESEGRDPGPHFSIDFYRYTYLRDADLKTSAFFHYERVGKERGYKPRPNHSTAAFADEQSLGAEIPELKAHIALMALKPRFVILTSNISDYQNSLRSQIYPHWHVCDVSELANLRDIDTSTCPIFCVILGEHRILCQSGLYRIASRLNQKTHLDLIHFDEERVSDELIRKGSDDIEIQTRGITLSPLEAQPDYNFCVRLDKIRSGIKDAKNTTDIVAHVFKAECANDRIAHPVAYRLERDYSSLVQDVAHRAAYRKNVREGAVLLSPFLNDRENEADASAKAKLARRFADVHVTAPPSGETVVVYLARGFDPDAQVRFARFLRAYESYPAGATHRLLVVFKGFQSPGLIEEAQALFGRLKCEELHIPDEGFDLTAYSLAVRHVNSENICFLNTNSEPASCNWLYKLAVNLAQPGIGMVSATASFLNHQTSFPAFPDFPNMHLRTNGFMMHSHLARRILRDLHIETKSDAWVAESGGAGITRQVIRMGYAPLLVGANGRGYAPQWWSSSDTYCQGEQSNVLIHDNQTRFYEAASDDLKRRMQGAAWGDRRTSGYFFKHATT